MTSCGSWLVFSFLMVLFTMELRMYSCSRCQRGLKDCSDDLSFSGDQEKRTLWAQNCRFACLGRKREADESLKRLDMRNPENLKQTDDELQDKKMQKRLPMKSSRPPCQRFLCLGKRAIHDVVPRKSQSVTMNEMTFKRKASQLPGCWRFGGCKKTIEDTLPLSETEMERKEDENSKLSCFRFGCRKRGRNENFDFSVTPNEEKLKRRPVVVEDTSKPGCWRIGCKRSEHLQEMLKKITDVKRFDVNNPQMRFDRSNPESNYNE